MRKTVFGDKPKRSVIASHDMFVEYIIIILNLQDDTKLDKVNSAILLFEL